MEDSASILVDNILTSQNPKQQNQASVESNIGPYNHGQGHRQGYSQDHSSKPQGERAQGLRSSRAPVVRGTAVNPPGNSNIDQVRPGWKSPPRDIFVYHTAHETTEDDIKELIKMTSKVQVLNVEKRSNEFAYYGSFRVTLNRADFDKALDPNHWPIGWSVREYFHARKKKADNSETDRTDSTKETS